MAVAIPNTPQPSKGDIASLKAVLGGKLPLGYLEFIQFHDGAKPEDNSITIGIDNESGVRRFIPVGEAASLISEVEGFPSAAVPLAEDDCGNFFYVSAESGAIFFWDHETESGQVELAPTLAEFLLELAPLDASSVKLAGGQVKRVWVNPAFKPEFD